MNIVCLFIILCFIYFIYYNVFKVNVVEGVESDSGSEENCDKIKGDLKDCRAALDVNFEAIEEIKAQIRQKLEEKEKELEKLKNKWWCSLFA